MEECPVSISLINKYAKPSYLLLLFLYPLLVLTFVPLQPLISFSFALPCKFYFIIIIIIIIIISYVLIGIYSFPPTFVPFCYTSCFLHIYPVYYNYLLVLPFPIVSLTTTGPFLHFLHPNHLYLCLFYAVTLKTDISTYLPNYIDNHNPEDTNFHGSFRKNI